MKPIIPPVDRELLRAELTPERKVRDTNKAGNEIYVFSAAECPSLMREVGRLREEAFRGAGGGTGEEVDIDEEDTAGDGYYQLIVWDPAAEQIVGGYRFIVCTTPNPRHLSTEHYFRFSDRFRRKYLPHTIELGRSFVQPAYQARANAKSIYALDNLWDGIGALIVLSPRSKYLFGKVTMYTSYKTVARNALIWFLRRYFPDREGLVEGIHPLRLDLDAPYYEELFHGETYMDNYRILIQKIREFNENIPPLINAYMNLSPTMRVFDTVSNPDFGDVEETGILVTIRDIYPEKRQRYTRWKGWRANLKHRREEFGEQLREHLERIRSERDRKRAERSGALSGPPFPVRSFPVCSFPVCTAWRPAQKNSARGGVQANNCLTNITDGDRNVSFVRLGVVRRGGVGRAALLFGAISLAITILLGLLLLCGTLFRSGLGCRGSHLLLFGFRRFGLLSECHAACRQHQRRHHHNSLFHGSQN